MDDSARLGSVRGCDLLLVGAFAPELDPLVPVLGSGMIGDVANVRVVGRACGIGLPSAAANAVAHIQRIRPKAVVFVGTCGAYRSRKGVSSSRTIGEVVVSRRILLKDALALSGSTAFPPAMLAEMRSAPELVQWLAENAERQADVATTLAITVDDAMAARIEEVGDVDVEHLEAYAVATAASVCGVPFAAVLGIANFVGAQGREEWKRHHRSSAAGAVAHLVSRLHASGGFFAATSP